MPERVILQPTDPVDVHMHTYASDGRWQPVELADYLAAHGFRVVAVADHDTMHSVPEMSHLARERGIAYIPAVEMTTRWRNRQVHLLVYGVWPDAAAARPFRELLALQQDQLRASAEHAAQLLAEHGRMIPSLPEIAMGLPLTPHRVFTAMIRHGHGNNLYQAHNIVRALGEPARVDVPLDETVAAVHDSGGIVIVAHPGRDDGSGLLLEPDLDEMRATIPIDGIEAHYRSYKDADIKRYRDYAEAHGLLVSAGSDSHWPNFPVNPIPWEARWIAPFLNHFGMEVEPWEGPAWVPKEQQEGAPVGAASASS